MYRYGWPLSNLAAKLGIPIVIKLEIEHDTETNVWIATSPDLRGLVLEAESVPDLIKEAHLVVPELLRLRHAPLRRPAYISAAACA